MYLIVCRKRGAANNIQHMEYSCSVKIHAWGLCSHLLSGKCYQLSDKSCKMLFMEAKARILRNLPSRTICSYMSTELQMFATYICRINIGDHFKVRHVQLALMTSSVTKKMHGDLKVKSDNNTRYLKKRSKMKIICKIYNSNHAWICHKTAMQINRLSLKIMTLSSKL